MKFLRYFGWTIFPATLVGVYLTLGLPYLNASYDFRDNGQAYDPWAKRHYLRCNFWNPIGKITIYPHDGKCPRIKFFKNGRG